MQKVLTIKCAECGAPYQTHRLNAKYCPFHRFMRDFMFAHREPRPSKCQACSQFFQPVKHRVVICYKCYGPPESNGIEQCYICKCLRPKVHKDVAICGPCAEDPHNTERMLKLLTQKDRWLKRQNQPTEQEQS